MSQELLMKEALAEAEKEKARGEVPIGAVIVVNGEIIARAHNEVEELQDATAHAEILAIKRASKVARNWRLSNASLYVTLEPCVMCVGAMINARIKNLYFGAYDQKQGTTGSIFDLSSDPQLPHAINVYPEVMKEEAEGLLKEFFTGLRKKNLYRICTSTILF